MKELRCIVFTDREIVSAVVDRRRRVGEPLPPGAVSEVTFAIEETVTTRFRIVAEDGGVAEVDLGEAEVIASMVAYCMSRRIPLPVDAEKTLYVIRDALTLMITLNFNRAPRLVVDTAVKTLRADRPRLRAVS